jgi:AbrB family looped-hinge helix DNA binding protein
MPSSTQASQAEPIESSSDCRWTPSTVSGPLTAHTRINANGRIVIPAAMREKLGLQKDDSIVMEVEDGVLRIESYLSRIRRIQAEFAHLAPVGGLLASDELITERRQEAQLENETFERARELRRIRDGFGTPESHAGTGAAPIEIAQAEEMKLA